MPQLIVIDGGKGQLGAAVQSLRKLNLMGKVVYDANWEESANQKKVKSWAYIAQLNPPGDCMRVTFAHEQIAGGDTRLKLNFEFTFDGVPKPALPPEALDTYGF